jgi:UDP-N-acetyl-D-mannosaminuronic acid transferase (WecB/TagA/CpsF family)
MKDDTKKEIAVWRDKFDAACGRINQLTTTINEMRKQLEYQTKLFANIRKELRVEKNSEILSAIKEAMSK